MLRRETRFGAGYTPPIAAGIRPMYLRARDRGYSRGYEPRAGAKKMAAIQVVSVSYSTPAGGARPLVVYSDEIGDVHGRSRLARRSSMRAGGGSDCSRTSGLS